MFAPDYSHLLQNDEPRWDTARVAEFWGVSTKLVSEAARRRRIPGAVKPGDEWRFNPAIIRAMEGLLPPATDPRPHGRRKEPDPLKNPRRPGRRGHPEPVAAAPPEEMAARVQSSKGGRPTSADRTKAAPPRETRSTEAATAAMPTTASEWADFFESHRIRG